MHSQCPSCCGRSSTAQGNVLLCVWRKQEEQTDLGAIGRHAPPSKRDNVVHLGLMTTVERDGGMKGNNLALSFAVYDSLAVP